MFKNRSKRTASSRKSGNKEKTNSSTLRRVLRLLPGILFALLTVFLFSRVGMLHKLQTFVIDTGMRLNNPPQESDVVIIDITDEDYNKIFQGRRPLDPITLQSLIQSLAIGKPKVIGVDIDTSSLQFRSLKIDDHWPPVVWEREPKTPPESINERLEPLDVLGGQDPSLNSNSGLPVLIEDSEDKVTRRYRRLVNTTLGPLPSFTWSIITKAGNEKTLTLSASPDDDFFIRYSPDPSGVHRITTTASQILDLTKNDTLARDNILRDKVVLLGGTYLGQDRHDTPLGTLNGVEILAQVVETELQGGGDRSPTKLMMFLMEVFEGILLVILFELFHQYRFVKALAINLLTLLDRK